MSAQPSIEFYNFDFATLGNWTFFGDVTVNSYAKCVTGLCWRMEGAAEGIQTVSTVGYHDITIIIDMKSTGIDKDGEFCAVYYRSNPSSFFNLSDNCILDQYSSNSYLNCTTTLPNTADYNDNPQIQLELNKFGDKKGDYCFYDNLRVIGIPFTNSPTKAPTKDPTLTPSFNPTLAPTNNPTKTPTQITQFPSDSPTGHPTFDPTYDPTKNPTNSLTKTPTFDPTKTFNPTKDPTKDPTFYPTFDPTNIPSQSPTPHPILNIPTVPPAITTNPTQSPNDQLITTETDKNKNERLNNDSDTSDTPMIIIIVMALIFLLCLIGGILIFVLCKRKNRQKKGYNAGTDVNRVASVSNDENILAIPDIETNGRFSIPETEIEMNKTDKLLTFDIKNDTALTVTSVASSMVSEGVKLTMEGDDGNQESVFDLLDTKTPKENDIVKKENDIVNKETPMSLGDEEQNVIVSDMIGKDFEIIGDEQTKGITEKDEATDNDNDVVVNDYETETNGNKHITVGGPNTFVAVVDNEVINEIEQQFEMNDDFAKLIDGDNGNQKNANDNTNQFIMEDLSDDELLKDVETIGQLDNDKQLSDSDDDILAGIQTLQ